MSRAATLLGLGVCLHAVQVHVSSVRSTQFNYAVRPALGQVRREIHAHFLECGQVLALPTDIGFRIRPPLLADGGPKRFLPFQFRLVTLAAQLQFCLNLDGLLRPSLRRPCHLRVELVILHLLRLLFGGSFQL